MKEKEIIKDQELERIDSELFDSFSEDEMWIGGVDTTLTYSVTFTPTGRDAQSDFDVVFPELT